MIIIIDDNPIQRQVIRLVVKSGDIKMPETTQELDALMNTVNEQDVECVLLDRMMPSDWEEAAMRLLQKIPNVPVIEWSVSNIDDKYFKRPDIVDSIKKTGTGVEIREFINALRQGKKSMSSGMMMFPFMNLFSH